MSGVCGYLGRLQDGIGGDSAALLRRMGERMAEFDASPVRSLQSGPCGLAVAAQPDSISLHKKDGVLAAVWGRPLLDGSAEQVALRLAGLWGARGPRACAALSGAFAVCLVDCLTGQVLLA
ncbi:MAG: asparagine synthase, partial [Duganella sp.]